MVTHINSVVAPSIHCSDVLCMKLRNYKGKHDLFYLFFNSSYCMHCIYNVVVVVVVVVEINFNSISKVLVCCVSYTIIICVRVVINSCWRL